MHLSRIPASQKQEMFAHYQPLRIQCFGLSLTTSEFYKDDTKSFSTELPEMKTLNLHSPTFPVLSDATQRILCSPAANLSPGFFPLCVTLGINSELSVAVGAVHITVAHVVPRSADLRIFEGHFENAGPETSSDKKKNQTTEIRRLRK